MPAVPPHPAGLAVRPCGLAVSKYVDEKEKDAGASPQGASAAESIARRCNAALGGRASWARGSPLPTR